MPSEPPPNPITNKINSDGGAVAHHLQIDGDHVGGDSVNGDKVDGSKITINVYNIPPEQWEPLFARVLGPDLLSEPHNQNLQEALRQLSGYSDDTLPLKFLTLLRQLLPPEEAQKLTAFIEQETKLSPTELKALEQEVQKVEPTYLLVEIEQGKAVPNEYTVRIYQGVSNSERPPTFIKEEANLPLGKIAQFIHTVEASLKQETQTIEIFLPVGLLAEQSAVEHWQYEERLDESFYISTPLFAQHTVAVRIQERQYGQWRKKIIRWQDKWRTMQSSKLDSIVQRLSRKTLRNDYLINNWPTANEKAFVVLEEKPSDFEQLILLLMRAHVPAILWHRASFQPAITSAFDWRTKLSQVWQECDAQSGKTLFDVVHNWRICGGDDPEKAEIGQHLTLIWENPYRMLPEYKFDDQELL
jgi:hypothetical protein